MTDETKPAEQPKVDGRTKEAKAAKAPLRPRADGPSAELKARREARLARGEVDYTNRKRLTLAGASIDLNNYAYRWANDDIGNLRSMEAREWEKVSEDELNGLDAARLAGLSREGKAMNTVLMKKWRPWFEADQDAKVAEYREREKALKRGLLKPPENPEDAGKSYALPTNQISAATPTKSAGGYTP